ncbi:MAG: hypothetical protein FH749_13310 [Firmicutes bacterium]|nr:hypothetical protein [Bacillota bacterium]
MKAKTFFISLLGAIFLVIFSLSSISSYIEHSSLGNISLDNESDHKIVTHMMVLGISDVDELRFVNTINDWSKSNNISIVRSETDQRTKTRMFYVSGNNNYYDRLIIDNKNTNEDLHNIILDSRSSSNRLVKGLGTDYKILPMTTVTAGTEVNNLYFIYSNLEDISSLDSLLASHFSEATISFSENAANSYEPVKIFDDFGLIAVFIAINLLLFIFVNNHILSSTKRISIQKTEGRSLLYLWFNLSFKYFLASLGILLGLGLLLSNFFVSFLAQNSFVYYGNFLKFYAAYTVVSLAISLLPAILVNLIIPVRSLKGHSGLKAYLKYLSLAKVIVIVVTIMYLLPNVKYAGQIARSLSQESAKEEVYENLFSFDAIYAKYSGYYDQHVFGNENQIITYMQENNGLFSFASTAAMDIQGPIYLIDKQYLINKNIWEDSFVGKRLLFSMKYQSGKSDWFDYDENIIFEVESLENYDDLHLSMNTLFTADPFLRSDAVLYYNGDENPASLLNNMFFFQGSLDDAREYIEQVMIQHGFQPCYLVSSFQEQYSLSKARYIKEGLRDFIVGLLLLIIYIDTSLTYYKAYMESRTKSIMIKWTEGFSRFEIFESIFANNLLFLISVVIVLAFISRTELLMLSYVAVSLFFVELFVLMLFIIRLRYSDLRRYL